MVGEAVRGLWAAFRAPTRGTHAGLCRQFGVYRPAFYIVFGRSTETNEEYYR